MGEIDVLGAGAEVPAVEPADRALLRDGERGVDALVLQSAGTCGSPIEYMSLMPFWAKMFTPSSKPA